LKYEGNMRKLDRLGRIVIPVHIRRILGIEKDDSLDVFVRGMRIILHKYDYSPRCVFFVEILTIALCTVGKRFAIAV